MGERELIKAEGMVELKNYHFKNIIIIINSAKKHQWILKTSRWKIDEERDIM